MGSIRVFLVDDHAMVRSGLALLIHSQDDMQVVGEAEEAETAVRLVEEHQPDIVVLDLSMPGGGGLKAIDQLREVSPQSRILVLTMHDDYAYMRAAMAAGTAGYVVKTAADRELISAIRTLSQGRTYISLSFTEGDLESGRDLPVPGNAGTVELSKRERQVLEFVAYGYTSQQIADHLGLSVKTVDGYRARISEKLDLRNRADLVRFALENGVLDPSRPIPRADSEGP